MFDGEIEAAAAPVQETINNDKEEIVDKEYIIYEVKIRVSDISISSRRHFFPS